MQQDYSNATTAVDCSFPNEARKIEGMSTAMWQALATMSYNHSVWNANYVGLKKPVKLNSAVISGLKSRELIVESGTRLCSDRKDFKTYSLTPLGVIVGHAARAGNHYWLGLHESKPHLL